MKGKIIIGRELYLLDFVPGDRVFLKTDPEQRERIVTGIRLEGGSVMYVINLADIISVHYGFELSEDKDISKI